MSLPSWVDATKKRYDEGGEAALQGKKHPGSQPKISAAEVDSLIRELEKGTEAHGFIGHIWTRKRVGIVIERLYRQQYDPSQVGRILRKAGWSKQQPQVKAGQQSPEKVKDWKEERLPDLRKKPGKKTG